MNASPEEHDVIVIGGGPAGATTATLLAREGKKVLVLERARFPRFHIGESITAWGSHLLRDLGVYEELKADNFIRKRGLQFVLHDRTRKIYFSERDGRDEEGNLPWAFQMPRERFDQVLLNNARRKGADVREGQAVERVLFDGDRAVGVEWKDLENGMQQRAKAPWIVDASGSAGVLNRQLPGNSSFHHLLHKKISVFGHFRGDFGFENGDWEIHFKLCVHRNGRDWAWWLPIGKDLCSVGVTLSKETVKSRKGSLEELFRETIAGTAFLDEWMQQEGLEQVGKLRSAKDFSYTSRKHAGKGWALVGDSAGFIDPVFSTGLQITFNSAFWLSEALLAADDAPAQTEALLDDYCRAVDRSYRINGTLVHLFYLSGVDPDKFEDPGFMWKSIPWAGWKYRLAFLYWGARLMLKPKRVRREMGEDVVFGNPKADNLIARQFLNLSRNFDEVYASQIASAPSRSEGAWVGSSLTHVS